MFFYVSSRSREIKWSGLFFYQINNFSFFFHLLDRDEIERLNSQLAQKSALLSRVKLLLERAAARERSLTEQVSNFWRLFLNKTNILTVRIWSFGIQKSLMKKYLLQL